MRIERGWQTEQSLQQTVQISGRFQIAPAHHMRDLLCGIVQYDRQMIACGHIFAAQHHIPP